MIISVLEHNDWKDLEDGLQMQSAVHQRLDYIVTRDVKDFVQSAVKVLSPEKLLQMLEHGVK
jgi:predicted nucleic acid-binding protein